MSASKQRKIITALSGVALAASVQVAIAAYPTKPVTVVVPFPAGGSTDLMGRATAMEFTDALGKNFVVSNVSGGAGTIGTASIARARNDGYTIGVVPAAPLVNQPHMRATPYKVDSFDYVCQLFSSPLALAAKPGSPFKNLKQFLDYAKAHPGELSYGSAGPGTLPHLAMEQLLDKAGIEVKHVPFQGDGPAVTALLGGHIDLIVTPGNVVKDKELNGLAIFSEQRVSALPNLPTANEQGFEMTAAWWGGVVAPKGVSAEVKDQLNKACLAASKSERFNQTLTKLGTLVKYRGPADFRAYVDEVSATNGRLIEKVLKPAQANAK